MLDFCQIMKKIRENLVPNHLLPVFVDHNIFFTISKVKCSDFSGEDWSNCAFFPEQYHQLVMHDQFASLYSGFILVIFNDVRYVNYITFSHNCVTQNLTFVYIFICCKFCMSL